MLYYKSFLNLNKEELYNYSKILFIKFKKPFKQILKLDIINKINDKLLLKLSYKELILLSNLYKINLYKKYNNTQLRNKLKYYIKTKYKYNLLTCYFYNKHLSLQNNIQNTKKINNTNNESFGITCEYVLCNLYKLDNNLYKRINHNYLQNLNITLNKFKFEFQNKYNLKCYDFLGYQNNNIDFLCKRNNNIKNITLSVKSNINNNKLCCPQNIGQCTIKSFINKINKIHYFKNNKITSNTKFQIKKFIIKNINHLFNIYFNNLFTCNYLLWVKHHKNNSINYHIIKKPEKIKLNYNLLKFSKNIYNWKECNTLNYNNKTIGIFQLHNNRDCIKFRFNLHNLLQLIK